MPGHTDAVISLSFSPDGKRLASGGGDMAVRFWDTTTHMPIHTCIGHRNHVLCTAWSPDHGSLFVSAGMYCIVLYCIVLNCIVLARLTY
jgi:ribosome assembly protein 4